MGLDTRQRDQPKNLKETIEWASIGATISEIATTERINEQGLTVFRIDVHDKDVWASEQSAEVLLPYFGELATQAYASRDEKRRLDLNDLETRAEAIANIADGDLSIANCVYCVMDKDRVVGFLVAEEVELSDTKNACNLSIVVTHDDYRNLGIGKELERHLFSSEKYDTITGCSSTPGAVIVRMDIGEQYGYTTYYCGYKNGVYESLGPPEEQKRIEHI